MEFPVDDSYSVFHCRMHLRSKNDRQCNKILHALHRNKALLFFMAVQTRIYQTKELSQDMLCMNTTINQRFTILLLHATLTTPFDRTIVVHTFIRISDHCRCSKVHEDVLFLTNALILFHQSLIVGPHNSEDDQIALNALPIGQ
jgi:hypothetical protein